MAFFGGDTGNATNDKDVILWIKTAQKPDYRFSVCTGAFILGKAGLLLNMNVTTFHESIVALTQTLPDSKGLSGVKFVDNWQVITRAGISAGFDGALHLVAEIKGSSIAKQTTAYMEYDTWVPDQELVIENKQGLPER